MKTLAALVVVLALAISANAQTTTTASAPATTTTNPCEIVKILQGGVLEMGKEPIPFTLRTKGCEVGVKEVVADGLEFSDVELKANRLTAKVKATTASSGTASFKLVDTGGTETESPDSVFLLILGPADIHVKEIANKAAVTAATTSKKVKALESRVETVSATRPTRDELMASISPLQARIVDLEKVVVALRDEVATANNQIAALAVATVTLADGQVALGNTEVKKRFWGGKKPLNPKVAAAAEQIRDAFVPPPAVVNAMDR